MPEGEKMKFKFISVEELREKRRKQDLEIIRQLNCKYGFDIMPFVSESKKWHHGLIYDFDKIEKYLLPCPFCGGEAEIVEYEDVDGITYAVGCKVCESETVDYYEILDAMVRWNTRQETVTQNDTDDYTDDISS